MSITSEIWWGREIPAPAIASLAAQLRQRWGLSAGAVGIKGNEVHLRGYHRSREWVRNSTYCTDRSYSVSETAGNKSGGDPRWCCALDLTLPTALLLQVCERLDVAVRAGRLEKVTEWYGNVDGDTRVDGYNNIYNRAATSDSSHLWHLHISFDRGRANEDHDDLYAILTGDDMLSDADAKALINRVNSIIDFADVNPFGDSLKPEPNKLTAAIKTLTGDVAEVAALALALAGKVDELAARPPVQSAPVDPAAIKAVLLDPEVVAAHAKAAADLVHADLAD